jgi:hypothetical protein
MIAIDYTSSNGQAASPTYLHKLSPNQLNDYQQVMLGIGDILSNYDSSNLIPLYGFGGMVASGMVSQAFAVNGNAAKPEVWSIQGALLAYKQSFRLVVNSLSEPGNLVEIINKAVQIARQNQSDGNKSYLVLLVITDGDAADMDATINTIIRATDLPLSILVAGVGDSDFKQFFNINEKLSGSSGCKRDILKFASLNKFKDTNPQFAGELLAQHILTDIPKQFMEYMNLNNVVARPRPTPEEIATKNVQRREIFLKQKAFLHQQLLDQQLYEQQQQMLEKQQLEAQQQMFSPRPVDPYTSQSGVPPSVYTTQQPGQQSVYTTQQPGQQSAPPSVYTTQPGQQSVYTTQQPGQQSVAPPSVFNTQQPGQTPLHSHPSTHFPPHHSHPSHFTTQAPPPSFPPQQPGFPTDDHYGLYRSHTQPPPPTPPPPPPPPPPPKTNKPKNRPPAPPPHPPPTPT